MLDSPDLWFFHDRESRESVVRTHSLEGGQVVTATHGLGASMAWRVVVVVVTASSHAFLF